MSLEDEWILVASGLIAHADGVLEAEEVDRLLGMLGHDTDPELYSEWLTFFCDHDALERRYAAMAEPSEDEAQRILEQAWAMAMVDGEHAPDEVKVLHRIGARFGLGVEDIERRREAWDIRLDGFATLAAECAAFILGGSAGVSGEDAKCFSHFIDRLPTAPNHREELREIRGTGDVDALGPRVGRLGARMREQCLRLLAPLVHDSKAPDDARTRYYDFAERSGSTEAAAEAHLRATR